MIMFSSIKETHILFDDKLPKLLGENTKFHHIGMAINDFEALPFKLSKIYNDPIQKVKVAFTDFQGAKIEFIQPTSNDSPVSNSLSKGIKLVHLCFEVDSIEESIKSAKSNGFSILSKPVPAVAFENKNIIWLFNKQFGLVELVERK